MKLTIDEKIARTPELDRPCPTCGAARGSWCKRPSGHKAMALHADRTGRGRVRPPARPAKPTGAIANFGGKNPTRLDPTDETVVVAVRLPSRVTTALDGVARRTGETRSAVARRLLLETLELS